MAFFKKELTDEEFIRKFIRNMDDDFLHYERDYGKNQRSLCIPAKKKDVDRIKRLLDEINKKSALYRFEIEENLEKNRTYIRIVKK